MQLLLNSGVILNTDNAMVISQHLNQGAVEYNAELEKKTLEKPKRGRKTTTKSQS